MVWKEITVCTDTKGSELIACAFFSIGCGGVKIIDKNDVLDIIGGGGFWDYIDEELLRADSVVRVSGFVPSGDLDEKLAQLTAELKGLAYGEITVSDADDGLWYDNWKKFYSPIEAGSFVVVPKWLKPDIPPDKTAILIDPGMAFGTGEHESTKLCLMLMSELDFLNRSVIDVGTGSGILGIGAAKKGARECYMCDIDAVAVEAAKLNCLLNCVDGITKTENADLLTKKRRGADIVLANLTADILLRLADEIKLHINKGGFAVLSGIIHIRKDEVTDAYIKRGFELVKTAVMGEWNALLMRY